MKKFFCLFVVVWWCCLFCACGGEICDPCNYKDDEIPEANINISLSADSPTGEIPPGERTLAIFTVSTMEKSTTLYGLDLSIKDNYQSPDYDFVYRIWIEDGKGHIIFADQDLYDGFEFWGEHDLPAGTSKLVVKGLISWGEEFDSEWSPRPEFRVLLNNVYTSEEVNFCPGGKKLIPKFTGVNSVESSLANDSPDGIIFEGLTSTIYKFNLWASQGDFMFFAPGFEVANFNGDFLDCTLWEGNTMLSDQYNWVNNSYIMFDNNEEKLLLITSAPRTFSLVCQSETSQDNQLIQLRFAGGHFEPGPSGMSTSIKIGPWSPILEIKLRDLLMVNLSADTPQIITPGVNKTLMRFKMQTSAGGEVKLYNLPFNFLNRPTGVYSNCHIEDALTFQTLNVGISGYNPGGSNVYETYFFGPSDGEYPGDSYNFTVIGTAPRTFNLACDVALSSETATTIQLLDVIYYQESDPFKITPDSSPVLETWVLQY